MASLREVVDGKVSIPVEEYEALCLESKTLAALEAGGVDNWEWYSDSLAFAGLIEDEDEED